MQFADILYEKSDDIAWLTINRPEVYNALRGRTTDEMSVALQDADQDDTIRVVVIAGSGPNAFSSGRDQSEDRSTEEYSGSAEVDFQSLIRDMPKPVIAMVDGFAIGAGNILAYMCDFTIASTRSRFGQTGPRVGSPASGFGVGYLAQLVGQKKAREIWMVCQQYNRPAGPRHGPGKLRRASGAAEGRGHTLLQPPQEQQPHHPGSCRRSRSTR